MRAEMRTAGSLSTRERVPGARCIRTCPTSPTVSLPLDGRDADWAPDAPGAPPAAAAPAPAGPAPLAAAPAPPGGAPPPDSPAAPAAAAPALPPAAPPPADPPAAAA